MRLLLALVIATWLLLAGCSEVEPVQPPPSDPPLVVVGDFTAIRAASGFVVTVRPGSTPQATVTATDVPRNLVTAVVRSGTLQLQTDPGSIPAGGSLSAEVVMPTLTSITATAGASVSLEDGAMLSGQEAQLDLTTGATFEGRIGADTVQVDLDAGATAAAAGTVEHMTVVAAGAGRLDAPKLRVRHAVADLSTGAMAEFRVTGTLSVTVTDGAVLVYRGKPRITQETVESGARLEGGKRA